MEATQDNTTMIDPDLFVRPDGLPIVFVLEDTLSPKWSLVKEQVEEGEEFSCQNLLLKQLRVPGSSWRAQGCPAQEDLRG